MSRTFSTMLPLGTPAPGFALPGLDGRTVALGDLAEAPALLVMFLCNHCPFVIHVQRPLVALVKVWQARGVAVVGINSNDVQAYPDDAPDRMRLVAAEQGYTFPYLLDATQEVAKAYRAACTPDFYLFDRARHLVYRGQLDDSRPGSSIPVTGQDLAAAVDAVLTGRPVPEAQVPSLGCNIKWRPGNAPEYYG